MPSTKYPKNLLETIVKNSTSYFDVLRTLGLKLSGGTQSHIKKLIKGYGIDTSHFLGLRNNHGENHIGGCQKNPWQIILVKNRLNGKRESINILRRALIEYGIEEQCKECGLSGEWNGKLIRLQIDHKNGDFTDNSPDNLQFLCPNCHSQTDTYGSKNIKDINYSRINPKQIQLQCDYCDKSIFVTLKSSRNKSKHFCDQRCKTAYFSKGNWPDNLKDIAEKTPIIKIAKMVGVTEMAVRKRFKILGIKSKPQGYWRRSSLETT